jgi:hypothetical protein
MHWRHVPGLRGLASVIFAKNLYDLATLMDTDMRLHYQLLRTHPAFRRQKSLANCIYNE